MTDLEIERIGPHVFAARNARGATVRVGRAGAEGVFTPGELLQIATAGCAAVTAEELLVRRAGGSARFIVAADKESRPDERAYDTLRVTFDVDLSGLDEAALARLRAAVRLAVERECTVSRTLERGASVTLDFA